MGNRLLGEATTLAVQTDYWRPDPAEASFREGRIALQRRTRAGLLTAVERFEETLGIDSTHTGAAANLGNALALLLGYGYRVPGGNYETAARALTMAERAVRLAPEEPRGYVVRGYLTNLFLGPVALVRADYQKAMSLETTDSDFASWSSLLLLRDNYNGAAITEARLAVERDPESPGRHIALALALLQDRRYGEADSVAGVALALQPDLRRARQIQAVAMLLAGRPDECLAREPWPYVGVRAACLEAAGSQAAAARLVDSLQRVVDRGRPQSEEYDDLIPIVELVTYHAWRGEATEATKYLRKAFERSPIGIDPRVARSGIFDPVLRDPAFATALQTLQDSAWPEVQRRVRGEAPSASAAGDLGAS
jgi:tetratricopeptide (TPR) repeat protein